MLKGDLGVELGSLRSSSQQVTLGGAPVPFARPLNRVKAKQAQSSLCWGVPSPGAVGSWPGTRRAPGRSSEGLC